MKTDISMHQANTMTDKLYLVRVIILVVMYLGFGELIRKIKCNIDLYKIKMNLIEEGNHGKSYQIKTLSLCFTCKIEMKGGMGVT